MKASKVMEREKEKGFIDILFNFFCSLKLTITLLILLAILSIIGTVITQNATKAEYIKRYGIELYNVLNFFNLFDMYHSFWFSAILLLLVINLIACSLNRFPIVWRQISRGSGSGSLEDSMLRALPYVERIPFQDPADAGAEEGVRSYLKRWFKKSKQIETDSTVTLYSEKGRFSRLGVYITHLSLLIILVGGILGSFSGFRGHVEILEGETVKQIFLRTQDQEIPKPIDFSIRCDDFSITYYNLPGRKEKHVKEYTSILTILENGKEVLKQTVQVNHPLHYKGLAFYQSTYGAIHDITFGIRWRGKKEKVFFKVLEGTTFPVPNTNNSIRVLKYDHQVHNFGEGAQVVLFKPNQEPRPFWLLRNFPQLDQQRGDEFILTVEEVSEKDYTGLQVTKDPGVWVVWFGCAMMIFGFIVSFFFSHQRMWVRIPKGSGGEIVLAGSTNKNRVGFEKAFGELVDEVRKKS